MEAAIEAAIEPLKGVSGLGYIDEVLNCEAGCISSCRFITLAHDHSSISSRKWVALQSRFYSYAAD
jgi:hypothetical protein